MYRQKINILHAQFFCVISHNAKHIFFLLSGSQLNTKCLHGLHDYIAQILVLQVVVYNVVYKKDIPVGLTFYLFSVAWYNVTGHSETQKMSPRKKTKN